MNKTESQTIQSLLEKVSLPFDTESLDFDKRNKVLLAIALQPYNISINKGDRIYLHTNKGVLIDFCSMTMNNILGQNDLWVKTHLIKFLLSDYPSYLTSRFETALNYAAIEAISKIGNIENPAVNHKQCNGSDVTELAIKSAYNRRKKGKRKLLSFSGSFHGQNLTNFLASDMKRRHLFFLDDTSMIEFIPIPPTCENLDLHKELTYSEYEILEKVEKFAPDAFALIVEPIQVNNEIHTFSIPFLKKIRKICDKNEVSLIFDEIQTACGWTGEESAAERYGVIPNVLALSKGLTGGNGPLAAIITDQEHNNLELGSAEKTNGADLRSLVVSMAVIERIRGVEKERIPKGIDDVFAEELANGLISKVSPLSIVLEECLFKIKNNSNGLVVEIRGDRLIRGIQLPSTEIAEKLFWRLIENGVWVRQAKRALIIKPPLVITAEEIIKACDIIDQTIKNFHA